MTTWSLASGDAFSVRKAVDSVKRVHGTNDMAALGFANHQMGTEYASGGRSDHWVARPKVCHRSEASANREESIRLLAQILRCASSSSTIAIDNCNP